MKIHFRPHSCFIACSVLLVLPSARAQNDQQTLRRFFEKARDLSDVKANGMPGFVLRGDMHMWVKKDTSADGRYLLVRTPEGRWKEQVAFPGYKRTRIGDGTQFWQVRSSEDENPVVRELDQLLMNSRAPKAEENDTLAEVAAKQGPGTNVECIKLSAHPPIGWTYCFDSSSGALLEVSGGHNTTDIAWKVDWQEYSKFQDWSGKKIALLLRGFSGKQVVLEVKFEEIKRLPQLPTEFFAPSTEATTWADCAYGTMWKIKERVQPQYPPSARMQRRQGTVLLYAVINDDGKLSGLKVVHSAGQELHQSAWSAVSHWRYERTAACSESKGRTETFIDVAYALHE